MSWIFFRAIPLSLGRNYCRLMINDFEKVMAERTDAQLAKILSVERENYQQEALHAAEAEFIKRQLSMESFYTQEEIDRIINSRKIDKADIKLWIVYKLMLLFTLKLEEYLLFFVYRLIILLFPDAEFFIPYSFVNSSALYIAIILHFTGYFMLKSKGYLKMAEDFKKWAFASWILYALYLIILVVYYKIQSGKL